MGEKEKRREIAKISIFITSLFVIFLSVTYAFINMTLTGTRRQVITAGNLELELLEDENNLTIKNAMPMYDDVGMVQEAFNFRLINKTAIDTNYILKLIDITTGERLNTRIVKYGLTKDGSVTIDTLSLITITEIVDSNEEGVDEAILDKGFILKNQTIEYSLRLWIDSSVEDNSVIKEKSLSYRIGVEASQIEEIETSIGELQTLAFENENIGQSCTTYDDGIDTFLVGQCQNNYVWYSGKLWRVVLKNNETGETKIVTEESIQDMRYGDTAFADSEIDRWLNGEFLSTLNNTDKYLVLNSLWENGFSSDFTRPNLIKPDVRTVGLLNFYEYYTASTWNYDDGFTYETGYLTNSTNWWLISRPFSKNFWMVSYNGNINYFSPNAIFGVRPSIYLQSNLQISKGDGSKNSPYKLIAKK